MDEELTKCPQNKANRLRCILLTETSLPVLHVVLYDGHVPRKYLHARDVSCQASPQHLDEEAHG